MNYQKGLKNLSMQKKDDKNYPDSYRDDSYREQRLPSKFGNAQRLSSIKIRPIYQRATYGIIERLYKTYI